MTQQVDTDICTEFSIVNLDKTIIATPQNFCLQQGCEAKRQTSDRSDPLSDNLCRLGSGGKLISADLMMLEEAKDRQSENALQNGILTPTGEQPDGKRRPRT